MSSSSLTPWKPATTAISPSSRARRTRSAAIRVMRALVWARSVRRPTWSPVKDRALKPRVWRAMASGAMVTCPPVASSLSISRSPGTGAMRWARATSSSVVFPMADTTTTSRCPLPRPSPLTVPATRRATFRIFSWSATDEPPYFCTISAMTLAIYTGPHRRARLPRTRRAWGAQGAPGAPQTCAAKSRSAAGVPRRRALGGHGGRPEPPMTSGSHAGGGPRGVGEGDLLAEQEDPSDDGDRDELHGVQDDGVADRFGAGHAQ